MTDFLGLVGCGGLPFALILATFLRAWAIVTLWTWFIYPTWHIAVPSQPAAIGLAILVAAITPRHREPEGKKGQTVAQILGTAYAELLLSPLFAVGFGWIVKHWM